MRQLRVGYRTARPPGSPGSTKLQAKKEGAITVIAFVEGTSGLEIYTLLLALVSCQLIICAAGVSDFCAVHVLVSGQL